MNTRTIPRDFTGDFPPGTWRPCLRQDGVLMANLSCPSCGVLGGLGEGTLHSIADDGAVWPSVSCDCHFHEFVRLEGWKPRIARKAATIAT